MTTTYVPTLNKLIVREYRTKPKSLIERPTMAEQAIEEKLWKVTAVGRDDPDFNHPQMSHEINVGDVVLINGQLLQIPSQDKEKLYITGYFDVIAVVDGPPPEYIKEIPSA